MEEKYLSQLEVINSMIRCHEKRIEKLQEQAAEILEKYGEEKENPTKTYLQDFMEKFPNAPKNSEGEPKCCRGYIYGFPDSCSIPCSECWGEAMEE